MLFRRSRFCTSKIEGVKMSLAKELDGARLVKYDDQLDAVIVWFGGSGITAYTSEGKEFAFWNLHSDKDFPTQEEVETNIARHIKNQDYLELYSWEGAY